MKTTIVKPHISEKSLLAASRGWYTFVVAQAMSKQSIGEVISGHYNVHVVGVRTISMHGKMRRVGRIAKPVKRPDWKKAMVQLKKGEKIDAFEVTGSEAPKAETPKEKPVKK